MKVVGTVFSKVMFLISELQRRKVESRVHSVERIGSERKMSFRSQKGSFKGRMTVTMVLEPKYEC